MLSDLRKRKLDSSVEGLKDSTKNPSMLANESWMETSDDEMGVGFDQSMSHQERYEWLKNRTYSTTKPDEA